MSSWSDGNVSAGGVALAFREKTESAELTNAANTSATASARMRLGFISWWCAYAKEVKDRQFSRCAEIIFRQNGHAGNQMLARRPHNHGVEARCTLHGSSRRPPICPYPCVHFQGPAT